MDGRLTGGIMKISFSSVRNRGITPDLRLVQKYLAKNIENVEFSYLIGQEASKNEMVKEGFTQAKKQYSEKADNVVCVDASVVSKTYESGKRILIAVPYDYQFNAINKANKGKYKKTNTFKGFSHIIVGSPFGKEVFEKCYNIPNATIIENAICPMAWDIKDEEKIKEKRNKWESYIPFMKGKKILSILTVGAVEEDEEYFDGFDWQEFLDEVDDDWFVVTNNEELINKAVVLDPKYNSKLIYVNKALDIREVLYFTDSLITNSGMYSSYLAVKQKPIYVMKYKNNGFEKYVKNKFGQLYFENLVDLKNTFRTKNEEHKKFYEHFSYNTSDNPNEVISKIFLG